MLLKKSVLVCLLSLATSLSVQAQVIFTGNMNVVTANSSLTVSGSLSNAVLGSTNYQQQAAGSLLTSYFGTINVSVNTGANTLQFFAPTAVNGNNSGSWQPLAGGAAGNAPAAYGVFIPYATGLAPINAALRTLTYSITSGVLPLAGGGSNFTFTPTQTIPITTGILDFRATGLFAGSGFTSLAGGSSANAAAAGSGSVVLLPNNDLRITFPVDVTFNTVFDPGAGVGNFTAQSRFVGTIQAIVAVPEPATIAMIGLGIGIAGYCSYRRIRQRRKQLNAIVQER